MYVEEEETSVDETEQVNNDEQMPMAADMPDEEQVNNNEQVPVADNLDETEQANNNNNNGGEGILEVGDDENQPAGEIALLRTTTPSKRAIKWIGGFALLCSLASLILETLILESHNIRVTTVVLEAFGLLLSTVSFLLETLGEDRFPWLPVLEFVFALLNFFIALCSLINKGTLKHHDVFPFAPVFFGISLSIFAYKFFH